MMSLRLFICCLLSWNASLFADTPPKWTAETLSGVKTFHWGINCYGTTLAAKGYSTSLAYVGHSEYDFYLENYCQRRQGPASSGDLIVLKKEGVTVHGALVASSTLILEKETYAPSIVRMLSPRDSIWLTDCGKDAECSLYQCPSADIVRRDLQSRCDPAFLRNIEQIRTRLEMFSLRRANAAPNDLSRLFEDFKLRLDQIRPESDCARYASVASQSISRILEYMYDEEILNLPPFSLIEVLATSSKRLEGSH